MHASTKKKFKTVGKFLFEVFYNVVIIIILVVILRKFIISPFKVVGPSMNDTLIDGQLILINKIGYLVGEPGRGDVIVFIPPVTGRDEAKFEMSFTTDEKGDSIELNLNELQTTKQSTYCKKPILDGFWFCQEGVKEGDYLYFLPVSESNKISGFNWTTSQRRLITAEEIENNQLSFEEANRDYRIKIYNPSGSDHFVKRIIGVPGDTLKFEKEDGKGLVYLKKAGETEFKKLDEPYLNNINFEATFLPQWVEEDTFVVPEGMYFGMGDNRGRSNDARSFRDPETMVHTPFITKEQMSGKVMMVLLPIMDIGWIGGHDL